MSPTPNGLALNGHFIRPFSISLYQHNNRITHSLYCKESHYGNRVVLSLQTIFSGVGIGDHKVELNKQLTKENSELRKDMELTTNFSPSP